MKGVYTLFFGLVGGTRSQIKDRDTKLLEYVFCTFALSFPNYKNWNERMKPPIWLKCAIGGHFDFLAGVFMLTANVRQQ